MKCTTLEPQSAVEFAKKGRYVRFLMETVPELVFCGRHKELKSPVQSMVEEESLGD